MEQALHGQLAVEHGDDDIVMLRFQRAVHDEDIAVVQSHPLHRVPGEADVVGGCWMLNQQLVQIEVAVQVIVGGRRESGGDQRQRAHQS
jgi:hypothetical protein